MCADQSLYASCMALICSRALEGLLQLAFVHRWAAADAEQIDSQSRLTRVLARVFTGR